MVLVCAGHGWCMYVCMYPCMHCGGLLCALQTAVAAVLYVAVIDCSILVFHIYILVEGSIVEVYVHMPGFA